MRVPIHPRGRGREKLEVRTKKPPANVLMKKELREQLQKKVKRINFDKS